MTRRKVDLRKVFLPSDSIAFIVILIGLFIALFLDEMAVRLIGVCIAVHDGVSTHDGSLREPSSTANGVSLLYVGNAQGSAKDLSGV